MPNDDTSRQDQPPNEPPTRMATGDQRAHADRPRDEEIAERVHDLTHRGEGLEAVLLQLLRDSGHDRRIAHAVLNACKARSKDGDVEWERTARMVRSAIDTGVFRTNRPS